MKRLHKILVPTDLSENSRRALSYSCWLAAEENAALIVLHVTNDLAAWEFYADEIPLPGSDGKPWPLDRVLAEKSLELSRFLEPSMADLKRTPTATKRVTLGAVPEQIAAVAEEIHADLIVMSPRRRRGFRHALFGSVTDTVTRTSPCPVLSLAPVRPSKPWRGEHVPLFFAWARRTTLNI
jgi:nucleotide-binding universal stress UspA family protein